MTRPNQLPLPPLLPLLPPLLLVVVLSGYANALVATQVNPGLSHGKSISSILRSIEFSDLPSREDRRAKMKEWEGVHPHATIKQYKELHNKLTSALGDEYLLFTVDQNTFYHIKLKSPPHSSPLSPRHQHMGALQFRTADASPTIALEYEFSLYDELVNSLALTPTNNKGIVTPKIRCYIDIPYFIHLRSSSHYFKQRRHLYCTQNDKLRMYVKYVASVTNFASSIHAEHEYALGSGGLCSIVSVLHNGYAKNAVGMLGASDNPREFADKLHRETKEAFDTSRIFEPRRDTSDEYVTKELVLMSSTLVKDYYFHLENVLRGDYNNKREPAPILYGIKPSTYEKDGNFIAKSNPRIVPVQYEIRNNNKCKKSHLATFQDARPVVRTLVWKYLKRIAVNENEIQQNMCAFAKYVQLLSDKLKYHVKQLFKHSKETYKHATLPLHIPAILSVPDHAISMPIIIHTLPGGWFNTIKCWVLVSDPNAVYTIAAASTEKKDCFAQMVNEPTTLAALIWLYAKYEKAGRRLINVEFAFPRSINPEVHQLILSKKPGAYSNPALISRTYRSYFNYKVWMKNVMLGLIRALYRTPEFFDTFKARMKCKKGGCDLFLAKSPESCMSSVLQMDFMGTEVIGKEPENDDGRARYKYRSSMARHITAKGRDVIRELNPKPKSEEDIVKKLSEILRRKVGVLNEVVHGLEYRAKPPKPGPVLNDDPFSTDSPLKTWIKQRNALQQTLRKGRSVLQACPGKAPGCVFFEVLNTIIPLVQGPYLDVEEDNFKDTMELKENHDINHVLHSLPTAFNQIAYEDPGTPVPQIKDENGGVVDTSHLSHLLTNPTGKDAKYDQFIADERHRLLRSSTVHRSFTYLNYDSARCSDPNSEAMFYGNCIAILDFML